MTLHTKRRAAPVATAIATALALSQLTGPALAEATIRDHRNGTTVVRPQCAPFSKRKDCYHVPK